MIKILKSDYQKHFATEITFADRKSGSCFNVKEVTKFEHKQYAINRGCSRN